MLGASLFSTQTLTISGGFYDLYHALKTEPVLGATMGAIMSTFCSCIISVRSKFNDYWYFSRTKL
ncbi:hypothetical protein ACV566_14510 [Staphylococcus aureus]